MYWIRFPSVVKREPLSKSALSKAKESSKKSRTEALQLFEMATQEVMRKMKEATELKASRREQWICEDIVVKIITAKLGEEFYKKKGAVVKVVDGLTAVVKLADGVKKEVPQKYLETVIPSPGRKVLFVNGPHIGSVGVLKMIDLEEFCCEVEITEGEKAGRIIKNAQYEDVSKLATY